MSEDKSLSKENVSDSIQCEEKQHFYTALFHSTPVGYVILDINYKILDANNTFLSMLNTDKNALIIKGLNNIVHQEEQKILQDFLYDLENKSIEIRLLKNKEDFIWSQMSGYLIPHFFLENGRSQPIILLMFNNIDILKRMETHLLRFQATIDNTIEVIFTIDPKTLKIVDCNEPTNLILKYDRAELFSLELSKIIPNISQDNMISLLNCLVSGEQEYISLETDYYSKNSEIFSMCLIMRPFKNNKGTHVIFTAQDITDRKKIEKDLLAKQEELDSFFSLTPDLLCIATIDGKFIRMNRVWEKMLGFSLEQLLQHSLLDFVHPEDYNETYSHLKNLCNSQNSITFTNRYLSITRGYCWLEWRAISYQNKYIYTIARDISQNIQQQRQIQQQIQEWHDTFNSMGHAIMILDAEYSILCSNKAQDILFGITKKCENQKCYCIVHRNKSIIPECFFKRVVTTGEAEEQEFYEPSIQKYIRVRMDPIFDEQKKVKKIVHQIIDITKQKEYEEKLKLLAKQAAAADAAKSQFLASMSHEIRTPINGILGNISLLRETALNEEQNELLDAAQTSAHLLLSIINDILDFSKIEAGQMILHEELFEFHSLIEDSIASLWNRDCTRPIEIISIIDRHIPQYLYGDAKRIQQIIINLVGNAIKFTEQGHILVTATLLEKDESPFQPGLIFPDLAVQLPTPIKKENNIQLLISVQDTGIGISFEKITQIFSPFVQGDNIDRKYGGTGLGLSICKKLVNIMSGEIGVASDLGKGSNFSFTISLKQALDASAIEIPEAIRKCKVMLITSNSYLKKSMLEIFATWGMDCYIYSNSEIAIRELLMAEKNNHSFDIVILEATSYSHDILQNILQISVYAKNRVIVLTPMIKTNQTVFKEYDKKFYSLLRPFQRKKILAKILEILSGKESFLTQEKDPSTKRVITARYEQAAGSSEKKDIAVSKNTKILLVEDNYINQKVAIGILKNIGYQDVDLIMNGLNVWDSLAKKKYDLILLDIQMPGMDGYSVIRKLRATPEYANIPVIAMTAHALNGDREKCLEAGMTDYIPKPLNKTEVEIVIQKVLERSNLNPKNIDTNKVEKTDIISLKDLSVSSEKKKDSPIPDIVRNLIWEDDSEVFNHEDMLKRVNGDEKIMKESLVIFVQDMPNQLEKLGQAIQQKNFNHIRSYTQSIKSVAENMSAQAMKKIAEEIEYALKANDISCIELLYAHLHIEFDKLISYLREIEITS